MKISFIFVCIFLSSTLLFAQTEFLKLKCFKIPNSTSQICISKTLNFLLVNDDVAFYSKSDRVGLKFLDIYRAETTSFCGLKFSDGGKYLYLSFCEEGHEFFVFYKTKEFLLQGHKAESIETLDEYNFKEFISFKDNAEVTYTLYSSDKEKNVHVLKFK